MRDKIKSVLADDAVEQLVSCTRQQEIVAWQYRVRTPDHKGWFGWDMVRGGEGAFRQQHDAAIAAGVIQMRPLYADQAPADAAHAKERPVAYITAHGFRNWMAGSGPEQHVLLRGPDGNMPRVPLYAAPVQSSAAQAKSAQAPVAYVVLADDGEAENIRIWWWNNRERAEEFASAKNVKLIPLYRDPK